LPNGSLSGGTSVRCTYRISLQRLDALVALSNGTIRCIKGQPAIDCPVAPKIDDHHLHLANIYRPHQAKAIKPAHVYVIQGPCDSKKKLTPGEPLPDRTLTKLQNGKSVTIVCWGDSVTVGGDASAPRYRYVNCFASKLKTRFPAASIKVINAGIGGSNTAGRFPNFDKEVLAHQPDLVTMEFVNDMGRPLEKLEARYKDIITRVRKAEAELILITPHFTMPRWMGHPNGRGPDNRPAVALLRRLAREHKVPLADASRRWEAMEYCGVPYLTLLRNGINHPDDRGHAIFVEELLRLFPTNSSD